MADHLISLEIGDTTIPIPPHILSGLVKGAAKVVTAEGYNGYGAKQGQGVLRENIAFLHKGHIRKSFVSIEPSVILCG